MSNQYKNLNVHDCYSELLENDVSNSFGFITEFILKEQIGDNKHVDFYCPGPKRFMAAMYQNAISLRIDKNNIYYESFVQLEEIITSVADAVA